MKRVIKCNTIKSENFDLIRDAISNSDIKDGYREELKYGYVIKKN